VEIDGDDECVVIANCVNRNSLIVIVTTVGEIQLPIQTPSLVTDTHNNTIVNFSVKE
jgi:hypothetical protein